MFKKITLKNGLRIVTVPQANTEAVTVFAIVGTGSKYERKEISGISHFLEHMFFKGTQKRPSPLKIIEPLDKVGGLFNAFTGEEYTGYFAKVAADQVDIALDWVSDIYLNSLLPQKEMEKERGVIIEEINMYLDTPMMYIGEIWKDLLYGDQPAGWDIAGTKETVRNISRQQMFSYRKSQYTAPNTVVCVAGNIKEDQIIEKVKDYFKNISKFKFTDKVRVLENQKGPGCLVHYKKTDQSHFHLGVRTYSLSHPDKYVLEVMSTILGGMMSSRLFTEIREKLGLAYYVRSENVEDTDTGYLVVKSGVDNQRIDKAIITTLKEFKKISEKKVSVAELKKAKENVKGKLSLSLESSDAKAFFYAGQEIIEKKMTKPEDIFKAIDKVSANDILRVAKDIFKQEKLNLAIIGPFEDKERFQKLLKI